LPVRETCCGLFVDPSETESKPVNVLGCGCDLLAGPSKLSEIVQEAPRARALGQLFVSAKYVPLMLISIVVTVEAPVLVNVAFCGGVQLLPTNRASHENSMLPGVSVAVSRGGLWPENNGDRIPDVIRSGDNFLALAAAAADFESVAGSAASDSAVAFTGL